MSILPMGDHLRGCRILLSLAVAMQLTVWIRSMASSSENGIITDSSDETKKVLSAPEHILKGSDDDPCTGYKTCT